METHELADGFRELGQAAAPPAQARMASQMGVRRESGICQEGLQGHATHSRFSVWRDMSWPMVSGSCDRLLHPLHRQQWPATWATGGSKCRDWSGRLKGLRNSSIQGKEGTNISGAANREN